MAKKRKPQPKARATQATAPLKPSTAAANWTNPTFIIGLLLCAVAISASGALVLERVASMPLPGCERGTNSPCERASNSAWGKVPWIDWPVSFLGFAYFDAVLASWVVTRGRTGGWLQNVLRAGAAVSVLYLTVIFSQGYACKYCIATHIANLLLWGMSEATTRRLRPIRNPLPALAATFAVVSAGVGVADYVKRQQIGHEGDIQAQKSIEEIKNRANQTNPLLTSNPATTQATPPLSTRPAPPVTTTQAAAPQTEKPFTGRYRRGPEKTSIRLVLFSDFQCPDCRMIEAEVDALLAKYPDKISFSAKHFPFCKECNPNIDECKHGNACWAARAVEAAGILRGSDGFWQMHAWLFANQGSFTDQSLPPALQTLGYEPSEFIHVMTSDQTVKLVRADVDEAIKLGIFMTPMIFINGVELKGWREQLARDRKSPLPARIEELIAANLPPAGPENDRPPSAADSMVSEWRDGRPQLIPAAARDYTRGPTVAKVRVVIFGDYQEPGCAKADETMRRLQAQRPDMSYAFRLFPFNQQCNPGLPSTKFPAACLAARAALAAGDLGGPDTFWRMHEWLFAHQSGLTEAALIAAATGFGLDEAKFRERMASPEVAAALKADEDAARGSALLGIPHIFVNGKNVPRWVTEGPIVLEKIVAEAGQ